MSKQRTERKLSKAETLASTMPDLLLTTGSQAIAIANTRFEQVTIIIFSL
jgi:hypothetical protein